MSNQPMPAEGTYVPGTLVSRPNNKWDYDKIIGYTYVYNRITGYQYSYYTYSYPTYTYNFANYATNSVTVTNHYDHVLYSGTYLYTGSSLGSVIVLGTASLALPNGLSMSGGDSLAIANNGATLNVYCGGTSASISGNGVINQAGNAVNVIFYCMPTVTSVSFSGNGQFTGILVAPNANVTMNGGGSSNEDFSGALIAGSIHMNGHFKFHYDESLGRKPLFGRLLITSWDEIDPKTAPGQ